MLFYRRPMMYGGVLGLSSQSFSLVLVAWLLSDSFRCSTPVSSDSRVRCRHACLVPPFEVLAIYFGVRPFGGPSRLLWSLLSLCPCIDSASHTYQGFTLGDGKVIQVKLRN